MPARPDIWHGCQRRFEILPLRAFRQAIGHGALFGIDDEFCDRAMHARLVPACRVPDVIGARMDHRRQRCGTLIARLRVKGFGTAQRV